MSDELKLALAREIYPDSKRARKESFTPTQWAGVERAWAWVEEHYQPKEPTVKQENIYIGGVLNPPTPPWTEAQREAASPDGKPVQILHADGSLTLMDGTYWKKNHGGQWVQEPAPSPAPAGVPTFNEAAQIDAAIRTRDERIAEQAATIATLTKERDAALARVAELEKRGAVDVGKIQRYSHDAVRVMGKLGVYSKHDDSGGWVRFDDIVKHSRDVRRITREDAVRLWQRLPNSTWNELTDALRAIGFEVEA